MTGWSRPYFSVVRFTSFRVFTFLFFDERGTRGRLESGEIIGFAGPEQTQSKAQFKPKINPLTSLFFNDLMFGKLGLVARYGEFGFAGPFVAERKPRYLIQGLRSTRAVAVGRGGSGLYIQLSNSHPGNAFSRQRRKL
jgi:hypothetical protein